MCHLQCAQIKGLNNRARCDSLFLDDRDQSIYKGLWGRMKHIVSPWICLRLNVIPNIGSFLSPNLTLHRFDDICQPRFCSCYLLLIWKIWMRQATTVIRLDLFQSHFIDIVRLNVRTQSVSRCRLTNDMGHPGLM